MKKDIAKKIRELEIVYKKEFEKIVPRPKKAIGFQELQIIKYLIDHIDEETCAKVLVENLHLKKSTITEKLDNLEKDGMIERIEKDNDKRKKVVKLSKEAIKKKEIFDDAFYRLNQKMLKDISEEKLNEFEQTLEKIINNLKEEV